MKTYYLFRHALATKSDEGYGDSILTATILPEGISPIKRMAEFLSTVGDSANYCSELIRCKQTAAIISELAGKIFVTDSRLNEYYHESFDGFQNRIQSFVQDVSLVKAEKILICTHGIVVAAIKHMLTQNRFTRNLTEDYPKTGELWIVQGNTTTSMDFNKTE